MTLLRSKVLPFRLSFVLCTDDPAPSLQTHYRSFITTTSRSAPVPRIGTLASRGPPAHASPLPSGRQVPTFRTEAADQVHAASMPDAAWAVNGFLPDLSRVRKSDPGFDAIYKFSTCNQRFTHVRLPGPHLTDLVRLFLNAHHKGSLPMHP